MRMEIPESLAQELRASEFYGVADCVRFGLRISPASYLQVEEMVDLVREAGPRHPMDSLKDHLQKNLFGKQG